MGITRVVGVLAVAVVLGGGNCGGGTGGTDPNACGSDADCGSNAFCRLADAQCYTLGFCYSTTDCEAQGLTHAACVGSWGCSNNACTWNCAGAPLPGVGEPCGANDTCSTGLQCMHYYGIAGPSGPMFTSCEKRCTSSTQCGVGQQCVTIADGPGQVCRARNG